MICSFFSRSDIDGSRVEDVDCNCVRIDCDSGSRSEEFIGAEGEDFGSGVGGLRSFLKLAFSSLSLNSR